MGEQSSSDCDLWIAGDFTNQIDRSRGWEAECNNESRFLGKCIDGGHAGIGRRRGGVGTENSLRHLNRQSACVAKGPSKKGLRAQATPRRRRSAVQITGPCLPSNERLTSQAPRHQALTFPA